MTPAPPPRVLVLDPDRKLLEPLPGSGNPTVLTDAVATLAEAIDRLQRTGYDAVLLAVHAPDEVSLVARIRSTVPDIPVVAVSPDRLPALGTPAGGAVFRSGTDPADIASSLQRALEARELIRKTASLRKESLVRQERLKALREQHAELTSRALQLSNFPKERLRTLLMEDDADQADLLKEAFRRLGLPFPLPVAMDGGQAIDYLEGAGPYADRTRFPLPTLLLLDLDRPGLNGLEILSFIRGHRRLATLPVFMLTRTEDPEKRQRALTAGANWNFHKPSSTLQVVETLKAILVRWSLMLPSTA